MDETKVRKFIELAGQKPGETFHTGTEEQRKLGAQLLLSEVLEYVIHGLGVTPIVDGKPITEPDELHYEMNGENPDRVEMLDGLSDVAYTMYWNSVTFGVPLEEGFDLVCDNNLDKFVRLAGWNGGERALLPNEWSCGDTVSWPPEVTSVSVVKVDQEFYAVGKDARGKVRKPSSYRPVDLTALVA